MLNCIFFILAVNLKILQKCMTFKYGKGGICIGYKVTRHSCSDIGLVHLCFVFVFNSILLLDLLLSEVEALPVADIHHSSTDSEGDDQEDQGPCPAKVPRLFAGLTRRRNRSGRSSSSTAAEFDRYLDLCQDQDFTDDPLAFWHCHQKSLPRLFILAKQAMSVVASSAPVERVFSTGGIFLRPHRSRLTSNVLSCLVFLKCNFGKVDFY